MHSIPADGPITVVTGDSAEPQEAVGAQVSSPLPVAASGDGSAEEDPDPVSLEPSCEPVSAANHQPPPPPSKTSSIPAAVSSRHEPSGVRCGSPPRPRTPATAAARESDGLGVRVLLRVD